MRPDDKLYLVGYFKDDQRRLYAAIDYLKKQDVPNCEG